MDESTIVDEDSILVDHLKLTLIEESEQMILKRITQGWNEGEYAVGGLKSMI